MKAANQNRTSEPAASGIGGRVEELAGKAAGCEGMEKEGFEEITYLDEYYLTNAEIEVLRSYARNIAEAIPSGSMVVELGSGNLRKVSILLEALDSAGKDIDYYALDLSLKELYRTPEQVPEFKHVRCHGLH